MGAWTVAAGDVDVLSGDRWMPTEGRQSIDLNGLGPGSITQQVATQPGQQYRISVMLAGNVEGPPSAKGITVTFGSTSRDFDFEAGSHTGQSMGWIEESFIATADAPTTLLTFGSRVAGVYGPAIDSVSVRPVGMGNPGGSLPCGCGS
jgi:choice-of-anchor C domain-containing protein